jgi:hypothetical protein
MVQRCPGDWAEFASGSFDIVIDKYEGIHDRFCPQGGRLLIRVVRDALVIVGAGKYVVPCGNALGYAGDQLLFLDAGDCFPE